MYPRTATDASSARIYPIVLFIQGCFFLFANVSTACLVFVVILFRSSRLHFVVANFVSVIFCFEESFQSRGKGKMTTKKKNFPTLNSWIDL